MDSVRRLMARKKKERKKEKNAPVQKLIGVVWQVSRAERGRVACGETEPQAADVDTLGLNDVNDPRFSGVDGPRRQHVAIAELGFVSDGSAAIGAHSNVESVSPGHESTTQSIARQWRHS